MEVLVLHRWSHMIQSIIFRLRADTGRLISLKFLSVFIVCLVVCNLLQFEISMPENYLGGLHCTAAQLMGLKDFTVLLVLSERLKLTLRTIFHVGSGIINQGSQFYWELWQLFIPVDLRWQSQIVSSRYLATIYGSYHIWQDCFDLGVLYQCLQFILLE